MDPIILLLASQLLIVAAILLTSSRKKGAKGPGALKPQVLSYVVLTLGLRREEDDASDFEIDAVELETVRGNKDDGLVIQGKQSKIETPKVNLKMPHTPKQGNKATRIPKAREPQCIKQSNSEGMCGKASKAPKSILFALILSAVHAFTLKGIKWLTSLNVKSPFKTSSDEKTFEERRSHSSSALRAQQGRPMDSNYLMRVILARKAEKAIRLKIVKLNVAIMKMRGARPLHAIPELLEQII